jgi:hypothetical protein
VVIVNSGGAVVADEPKRQASMCTCGVQGDSHSLGPVGAPGALRGSPVMFG